MTQREGYKTRMHSGYKSNKEKKSPNMLILMVLHFKTTTKITDRKLLMFAVYVFRSLYLNFGHGTPTHTIFILQCMLLCSICYFSLRSQCLISFYSFFTCARICTSEFLRHTTISLIKCLLRISFYTIQSTSCFGQRFPHFLDYFIRLPLVLKSVQLISASYPWF